jgi:transcriptional regulator with XRE-family HTH domain
MGFGDMLKQERERAGLSQSALGKKAGLPWRSIQNWEQGHRQPRPEAVLRLAEALGVPAEQLLVSLAKQWLDVAARKPRRRKGGRS